MKIISSLFFISISISIQAQFIKPNEVPGTIKQALDSIYPDNKFPAWKISNKYFGVLNYEATFVYNGTRTWVKIDSLANLIETEKEIDRDSIPSLSKEYISNYYDLKSIYNSRKIITKNKRFYFVGVRGNKSTRSYAILFDEEGVLLHKKNNLLSISANDFADFLFREFIFYY
jgi:hypothetical protein